MASVEGDKVTDTQGREYQTKFTRPVPAGSESVQTSAAAGGGSAIIESKQEITKAIRRETGAAHR